MAIVEPIPNFLPSATINSETAGRTIAVPKLPKKHSVSNCQKLLVSGIGARNVTLYYTVVIIRRALHKVLLLRF